MLSVLTNPHLTYPDPADGGSPDSAFPEYAHGTLSASPNHVYTAVRDCLAQAGLDAARLGTRDWNPLGGHVRPGSRVFVLCNFVQHRRGVETRERFFAKCVHGSVLRALVDYLLIAVGPTGRVAFGNSPLQSTVWRSVLEETGAGDVLRFYESRALPVVARDLRLLVTERGSLGNVTHLERRDESGTVGIDLGRSSLLEELPDAANARFRVPDYDPDSTAGFHAGGRHVYMVHREILDADVIVSLPKLKTHQKVGITCALKGFVGAIGQKDCLAHFRAGPATAGGDEYPSDPLGMLQAVSKLHDSVQRMPPSSPAGNLLRVVDAVTRRMADRLVPETDGGWYGNDTAWRMTLDIVRAATFGRVDGTVASEPQRKHLVLVDGVIGGDGNGPLSPDPVESRALLFSDGLGTADRGCALLMGFDPQRIPLIRDFGRVLPPEADGTSVVVNGKSAGFEGVGRAAFTKFAPASGWRGRIEPT